MTRSSFEGNKSVLFLPHQSSHVPSTAFSCLVLLLNSDIWVAHLVPLPVPPGLPQLAVSAVVDTVLPGKLIPGVPDISSLSPDNCQKGEPAQIHLKKTRQ